MKVKSKIAGVLAAMALLTGCSLGLPYEQFSSRKIKGYSGPDLPPEEVATIQMMHPLLLVGTDEIELPKPVLSPIITVLPGMRIIKIGCLSHLGWTKSLVGPKGEVHFRIDLLQLTTTLGGYRVIDVNVEAGHTYEIECEFRKSPDGDHYTWITPVFDDGYGEQIKATMYDGMLKPGFPEDPRRPYKRE